MKIHPKDLPENIRKHYQIKNATGGKIGIIYKAIKKNHTTIVVWSIATNIKQTWHKTTGKWILTNEKVNYES